MSLPIINSIRFDIAKRQQRGFGAMLSFELSGGVEAVRRFIAAARTFTLAESLGGVESLVAHPATMTHADMGAQARAAAGIGDGLLRLSVGLTHEYCCAATHECVLILPPELPGPTVAEPSVEHIPAGGFVLSAIS
jgi:hypothetical protein